MSAERRLLSVNVVDVEKRRQPSKHYVYIINVSWSDGNLCKIARRYSSFFNMHMALLDKFPLEGGRKDPSKRTLPVLPGKLFFRRSHTRDVTLERLGMISEYCQGLTKLPDNISQCSIIIDFFQTSADDQKYAKQSYEENENPEIHNITGPIETESFIAIADYKAEAKNQISLHVGEIVDVVDKNESGWWLVCNLYDANGYVPGAFLERLDGSQDDSPSEQEDEEEKGGWYTAKMTYNTTSDDEIGFPAGAFLEVLQKSQDGWWLVRNNEKQGWAPASYLIKAEKPRGASSPLVNKINGSSAIKLIFQSEDQKLPPKRTTIRKVLQPEAKRAALKRMETFEKEEVMCRLKYVTKFPLENNVRDGLSFREGQTVEVIEQADNGWWFVELDGKEGWVPANYLEPLSTGRSPSVSSTGSDSTRPSILSPDLAGNKTLAENGRSTNPAHRLMSPRPTSPALPKKQLNVDVNMLSGAVKNLQANPLSSYNRSPSKSPVKNPLAHQESDEAQYVAMVNFAGEGKKSLEDEAWFKKVGRVEAETALKSEGQEGYFIVRPSKSGGYENPYSLTLFHNRTIFHFHVRHRKDGRFATGVFSPGEKTFASVQELVEFYHENQLVVGDESNVVLLRGTPDDFL